ncbi:hypothetical protein Vadar_003602 [Vaccinium darrowii]|uniref:Uncharacterized protein n=1 Tax=Vaccinium darrowii TaxID=229202 RepID=A0ACB7YSS7_9ERIC|nr:hypothetical protein Vadar_003602 [Vaccinium darrowii]
MRRKNGRHTRRPAGEDVRPKHIGENLTEQKRASFLQDSYEKLDDDVDFDLFLRFFPRIPFAMTDKDQVLGIETIAPLLEQLGKAFLELEAHNDAAEDNVQWSEIEHYFQHLETTMKKKSEELELKEEYTEKESSPLPFLPVVGN